MADDPLHPPLREKNSRRSKGGGENARGVAWAAFSLRATANVGETGTQRALLFAARRTSGGLASAATPHLVAEVRSARSWKVGNQQPLLKKDTRWVVAEGGGVAVGGS